VQEPKGPTESTILFNEVEVKPAGGVRFLVVCLYIGLAPVVCIDRKMRGSAYWKTHVTQALNLWALLGITGIFLTLSVLALSVLMVYHRELLDARTGEVWILSLGRKCLLVWSVFWLYSVWRCLWGSSKAVPFLGILARYPFLHRIGIVTVSFLFCVVLLTVPMTLNAECLASQDPSRGKTFMLYDDLGMFPRPLFSLAMYRLSRESVRRWGPGTAVLLPLNRDTLNLAVQHGTFVFVGSHGTAAGLLLSGEMYRPEDVPQKSNSSLRYVYLASCDSGAQRKAWEEAFSPATVQTYDRLTPTLEHLWWLWTKGPALLRELPEPVQQTKPEENLG